MSQRTPSRPRAGNEKSNHKNPFMNLNMEHILAMDQPFIDINMPLVEKRLAAFKLQLGKYTAANAEEVTKRRNAHLKEVDRLRAERTQIEVDIQTYRLKEITLSKELEEEKQERKHVEELVAHNNRQLKSLQERLHEKEEEYKRSEMALERLRKLKEKEKRQLDKQASQVARDVIDLENTLGVKIRGIGNDVLRIVFTNIDSKDPERECSIVVDMSKQEYQVAEVSPPLGSPILPVMIERLKESHDLYAFIRQLRQAFATSLQP